jgi:hypothetical protein
MFLCCGFSLLLDKKIFHLCYHFQNLKGVILIYLLLIFPRIVFTFVHFSLKMILFKMFPFHISHLQKQIHWSEIPDWSLEPRDHESLNEGEFVSASALDFGIHQALSDEELQGVFVFKSSAYESIVRNGVDNVTFESASPDLEGIDISKLEVAVLESLHNEHHWYSAIGAHGAPPRRVSVSLPTLRIRLEVARFDRSSVQVGDDVKHLSLHYVKSNKFEVTQKYLYSLRRLELE